MADQSREEKVESEAWNEEDAAKAVASLLDCLFGDWIKADKVVEVRRPEDGHLVAPDPSPEEKLRFKRASRIMLNSLKLGDVDKAARLWLDQQLGRLSLLRFMYSIPGEILSFQIDNIRRTLVGFAAYSRLDIRVSRDTFLRLGVVIDMVPQTSSVGLPAIVGLHAREGHKLEPGFIRLGPEVSLPRLVKTLGSLLSVGNTDKAADLWLDRGMGLEELALLISSVDGRVVGARAISMRNMGDDGYGVEFALDFRNLEGELCSLYASFNARKGLRFCTYYILGLDKVGSVINS